MVQQIAGLVVSAGLLVRVSASDGEHFLRELPKTGEGVQVCRASDMQ